ncbi:MAG: patatin family protein [Lachnospiraceae bacterium]|nr:patatin family protein [Lachnospiraceae bacterium]
MNNKIGIILEGGAMRSIFTAGILDYYLEKNIDIPNVLAVSAGAYAGMNYVSGQKGRILDSVVNPMETMKVNGLSVFLKTGNYFDMDLLFDKIPKGDACPFDFEAFIQSGKRFITSTINCLTGEALYYDKFDTIDEFLKITRVANSLPILAKVGYIDGIPMLDGGMADAIPIARALQEGWEKIIVVLTRESKYRKKKGGDTYDNWFSKLLYRKYPGLLKAIDERPDVYNKSIETIDKLEKEGKVFLYRPPEDVILKNKIKEPGTLREYYKVGYEVAKSRYDELMAFLNA